ncbi:MAG: cytochrome P450 [Candidatus Binatia bacterium]
MTTTAELPAVEMSEAWWRQPQATMQPLLDGGHRAAYVPQLGAPMFLRYADCRAGLADDRLGAMGARYFELQGWTTGAFVTWTRRNVVMLDPPDHERLRRLVNRAFTPRQVERIRPLVTRIVTELTNELAAAGRVEFVHNFARLVPLRVICELLGVPFVDQEQMHGWTEALSRAAGMPDVAARRAGDAAMEEFNAYVLAMIAERRRRPSDDLLTALIQAEEAGDRLSNDELVAMVVQLQFAGHETTRNLVGNGLYTLLKRPAELARLRANRALIPSAVDEMLRYEPPITFTSRIAKEPMSMAGVSIAPGQFVVLMLAVANRDAERFADPNRFDVGRTENDHLSFGHGIHYCVGANLARMEGAVVFGTLLDRFRTIEFDGEESDWAAWTPLRGRERLDVRVVPA